MSLWSIETVEYVARAVIGTLLSATAIALWISAKRVVDAVKTNTSTGLRVESKITDLLSDVADQERRLRNTHDDVTILKARFEGVERRRPLSDRRHGA